jgi:uncharacterized protein (DUF58 family)
MWLFGKLAALRAHRREQETQFMHYDFCPWANRYVYWLKKPIGWLFTAALCSLLLGIYVAPQGFAVAAVVVGFMAIGMLWPAIAMRGVSAQLSWQQRRCSEGDLVETTLEVTNRWPWPVWGLVVETDVYAVNGGADFTEPVALACLKPMTKTKFVWDSKPTRRGLYPDRPAFLSTGFPFGIWSSRAPLSIVKSLMVWPKTMDLPDMPQMAGNDRSITGAWIDKAGYEGDIIGTRPYREGDPLRFVHWAQSAARDSLIVCERQSIAKRMIQVRILCSNRKPHDVHEQEIQEWLIRIGASLIRTFLSHQWSVTCEVGNQKLSAEPGRLGLERVFDSLALFQWEESRLASEHESLKPSCSDRYGRSPNALEIVIATDAQWQEAGPQRDASGSRWVILDNDAADSAIYDASSGVWMRLRLDDSVWPQLKREWERLCHESCATFVG